MKPVVLVQPPFGNYEYPSIALSTLKSVLTQDKIESEIVYANLVLAKKITPDLYHKISVTSPLKLYAEWLFSSFAYNVVEKNALYMEQFKDQPIPVLLLDTTITHNDLIRTKEIIGDYLKEMCNTILEYNPKIVGFGSLFQQTCASVAIAKLLKQKNQNIVTVMGGVRCNYPMGQAIHDISPSIDYIFTGDAEFVFNKFCKQILSGHLPDEKLIECSPLQDLDSLPYPDYSDYYTQMKHLGIKIKEGTHRIWFESSRGCWWGKKSHCIFCGSHVNSLYYREKSPERIKAEIRYFTELYEPDFLQATDNIMPRKLPTTVFQSFEPPFKLKGIYYEVKPTLIFKELWILKKNGVHSFQPGLESLNDDHLRIMKKGITAANNVRFLRDCKTLNIRPDWNILYNIPGETKLDYTEMMEQIPYLFHLNAPQYTGPLQIQRFSPLFNDKEKFGIKNLRVVDAYSVVYPENTNFMKLAVFFDGDYEIALKDQLKKDFLSLIKEWRKLWKDKEKVPNLYIINLNDEKYFIQDTRPISDQEVRIVENTHVKILRELREPLTTTEIDSFVDQNDLRNEFEDLLHSKYILQLGSRFISLISEPMWILELEEEAKTIS